MAKQVITRAELVLASRLAEAGIPVHEEALEKMRVDCYRTDRRGVVIRQCGGELESRAFTIPGRGTGYIVYTKITNDRGGMVVPFDVELRLPWEDRYFGWLRDPSEIHCGNSYCFPGGENLIYPRPEVINHLVSGRRRLRHSQFIEGALLGFSPEKIPSCFPHGFVFEAAVVVVDQLDIKHCGQVTLYVDRGAELTGKKQEPRRKRAKLFDESEDFGEPSTVVAGGIV